MAVADEQIKQENEDLKAQVQRLKEENEGYKTTIYRYRTHGAVGFVYEMNRFVNEATSYLRNVRVADLLNDEEKNKKLERTLSLIKSVKENVVDLDEITQKLKLTGDQKKDEEKALPIELAAQERK